MHSFKVLLVLAVATATWGFKLPCSTKIAKLVCAPTDLTPEVKIRPGQSDDKHLDIMCPYAQQVVKCLSAYGQCDVQQQNPFFAFYRTQENLLEEVCDKRSPVRAEYLKVAECYKKHSLSDISAGCGTSPVLTGRESAKERAAICGAQKSSADCFYRNLEGLCGVDVAHSAATKFRNSVLFFLQEAPECVFA